MASPPCGSTTICGGGLLLLLLLAFVAETVQGGASAAPALYVLGDSLVDVGNNNRLATPFRADFPHNGVDYPGHLATGRFSNGHNLADFVGRSNRKHEMNSDMIAMVFWVYERWGSS